jgi:hypothetical protein
MATSLTIGVALARAAFSSAGSDAEDLETLLRNWTRLEERENTDHDLVASATVPGYLETTDGEAVKIFVPMNLCRVSPTRAQREGIHSSAAHFRIRTKGDYCISGSATFLGVTSAIDDVDLAEYVAEGFPVVADRLREMAALSGAGSVTYSYLTIYHRSRKGELGKTAFTAIEPCLRAAKLEQWRKLRIDGAANLDAILLGEKEVSNMAFPAKLGQHSPESSVYQEIVVVDAGSAAAPRSLAEPAELNRYLKLMETEALKWNEEFVMTGATKPALKALKRTMSLLLMLGDRRTFLDGLKLLPPDLSSNHMLDLKGIGSFVERSLMLYREYLGISGAGRRQARGA